MTFFNHQHRGVYSLQVLRGLLQLLLLDALNPFDSGKRHCRGGLHFANTNGEKRDPLEL